MKPHFPQPQPSSLPPTTLAALQFANQTAVFSENGCQGLRTHFRWACNGQWFLIHCVFLATLPPGFLPRWWYGRRDRLIASLPPSLPEFLPCTGAEEPHMESASFQLRSPPCPHVCLRCPSSLCHTLCLLHSAYPNMTVSRRFVLFFIYLFASYLCPLD